MKIAVVLFFVVWMIIVWVGVFLALRMGWRAFKKDFRGDKTRTPAKVVHKREHSLFVAQTHEYAQVYELTFQCQDGQIVAFDVPERLYLHVSMGEEGMLVRQGSRFIEFEGPSGASEDADDLYRRLVRG